MWLDILRNMGVKEFEGPQFRVKFHDSAFLPAPAADPRESDPASKRDYKQSPPKTLWGHPNLWPGGKPPEFPK